MLVGNYEKVGTKLSEMMRCDKCGHAFILVDNVILTCKHMPIFDAAGDKAEGADILVGCVIKR